MSSMANNMDMSSESTASSNHQVLSGKTLVFRSRTEGHESEGSSSSGTMDHQVPRVIEPHTWFQASTSTPRHLAATPPPDEIPVTQAQLISGTGCLFPSLPPSRASSLTVSSDATAPSSSECPTTPVREIIKFNDADDFSTPIIQRKQQANVLDILFPQGIPWTPPPTTPRPTRQGDGQGQGKNKRASSSSPPPSPRPPKLARFQRWQRSSTSSVPRLLASMEHDDEGYCDDSEIPSTASEREHLGVHQQAIAFRNAQDRAFDLAASTSTCLDTEFRPTVAASSSRGGFHVFGSCLVNSGENDGNDGDDEAGESMTSVSATLDARSEDLALRSDSVGGTSIHCNYGQDELIVEVEWFTEDEIEAQLSEHLASYRAVYLASSEETDMEEQKLPTANEKERADSALEVFKMMAHGRLNWAELEMVLQEEEEDVLDVFMTWVQDMAVPKNTKTETFLDIRDCMGYLRKLTVPSNKLMRSGSDIKALPFIRKIRLWSNGCLDRFLDGLPGVRGVNASSLSFDGAIEWEFDKIYCGLAEKEVAELVTAWDDFMIRDE